MVLSEKALTEKDGSTSDKAGSMHAHPERGYQPLGGQGKGMLQEGVTLCPAESKCCAMGWLKTSFP